MPCSCCSRSIQLPLRKSTSRPLTKAISTDTSNTTDTNSCLCSFHLHPQVLLCSLTGDIFPKEHHSQQQAGNSSMRNEHLRQMLQMVWVWVPDPQAAVHQAAANEEAFLLDACRYAHCFLPCTASFSVPAFVICSVCCDASLMEPHPQHKASVLSCSCKGCHDDSIALDA